MEKGASGMGPSGDDIMRCLCNMNSHCQGRTGRCTGRLMLCCNSIDAREGFGSSVGRSQPSFLGQEAQFGRTPTQSRRTMWAGDLACSSLFICNPIKEIYQSYRGLTTRSLLLQSQADALYPATDCRVELKSQVVQN